MSHAKTFKKKHLYYPGGSRPKPVFKQIQRTVNNILHLLLILSCGNIINGFSQVCMYTVIQYKVYYGISSKNSLY